MLEGMPGWMYIDQQILFTWSKLNWIYKNKKNVKKYVNYSGNN